MVNQEVRAFVEQQSILALATVSEGGMPNVAPMYWKVWYDDATLLVLDVYMCTTKANIRSTGKASVAAWDAGSGTAYQLKGSAEYVTDGAYMDAGIAHMRSQKPGSSPKGVVVIHVTEAYDQQPGKNAGRSIDCEGTR